MRITALFLFLISNVCLHGQELNKEHAYFKIYEAAQKALNKDADGIRTLYKLSLEDHKDPMLNKMMIKSTVLGMVISSSKAIKNYILSVDTKFMAQEPLAFLERPPLQTTCYMCKGSGFKKFPCKDCFKGVCKNCKGKKKIGYKGLGGEFIVKNCPTCKANGICINCDQKGTASKPCHICFEKGAVFSKKAIPSEYQKSLKYIVDFMPKYAASKNVFITDRMVEIAKQDQLKKELEEARLMAEQRAKEEMEAREKERQAALARRKAKEEKEKERRKTLAAAFQDENPPSTMDDNLQHVLLEFNQFFRNRERIQKQSIYEGAEAKYEKGRPTLIINVTPSIYGMQKGLKLQYLEAFYNFFKLRCMSNGLGKKVGYIANYKKKQIASLQGEEVVLK